MKLEPETRGMVRAEARRAKHTHPWWQRANAQAAEHRAKKAAAIARAERGKA